MPRLEQPAKTVTIDLEGEAVTAREGESVACALLAHGETVFSRSVKYHRPRGPFCMAAACSHCLMRVNGAPNIFTCRTKVTAGMKVERQNAYPSAEHDVFGAIDWLFPKGMDHHAMFAGVPVAEQVMAKVARHLAGLGELPDSPAPQRPPHQTLRTHVAIAGAGAAGLAAARELTAAKVDFLLLEREAAVGGRLLHGATGPKDPPLSAFAAVAPDRLRLSSVIIGLFDDADGRYFAAVQWTHEGPRLLKVYAAKFLIATGGYPALWPFDNNDVPGVFAGRAVSRLIRTERYLPGEKFAVVGAGAELYDTARLIREAGGEIALLLDVGPSPQEGAVAGDPVKAIGRTQVRALTYKERGGRQRRVSCDAVALCVPASPAFELARQGGAELRYAEAHQGFVVEADVDGRTKSPDLFVAGELLGSGTAAQAADSGARAARAIAGEAR